MKFWKSPKFKKFCRYWLLVDLAVAVILLILLLYRPGNYTQHYISEDGLVSQYVSNILLPEIYNNAQLQQPFDLTIPQERTPDIVSLTEWPKESGGVGLLMPSVHFTPDRIVLMAIAVAKGIELVVTIVIEPTIDPQGLLDLHVAKMKVGAMNLTPIARVIAKRTYKQRLTVPGVNITDVRAKIAASLLNGEPFDPVFPVEDKKVRIEKITVTQGQLTIRFIPAYD